MLRVIVFSGVVLLCALFAVFGGDFLPSAAVPVPDALSPYIVHGWSRMALAAVLLVATLFVLDAVLPALLDLGRGVGTTRRLAALVERRRSGDAVEPGEFAAVFAGDELYAAASGFARTLGRADTVALERGRADATWFAPVPPHEAFAPVGERRAASLLAHVRLGLLLAAAAILPLALAAYDVWRAAQGAEPGDGVRPGVVCGMAIAVAAVLAAGGAGMALLARLFADLERRQVLGVAASAAELFPLAGSAAAARGGEGDRLSGSDKAGVAAALWVLEGRLQSLPAQIAEATAAGIERSVGTLLDHVAAHVAPRSGADERLDRIARSLDENNNLAVDIRDALHRTAAAIEAGAAAGGASHRSGVGGTEAAADSAAMLAQALAQQSVMLGTLVERIEDATAGLRSALLRHGETGSGGSDASAADLRVAQVGESVDRLRDVVEAVTLSIVPTMERLALSHEQLKSLLAGGAESGGGAGVREVVTAAAAVGEGARLLHALVERQSALVRDLAASVQAAADRPVPAAAQADPRAALAELARAIRDLSAEGTGASGTLPPFQQTA